MKKLLSLIIDSFLFVFLITILIVPVVVSFNLEPRVTNNVNSSVAGVKDERSYVLIEENLEMSENVKIVDLSNVGSSYNVNLTLLSGNDKRAFLVLGNLINKSDTKNAYKISIYDTKKEVEDLDLIIYVSVEGRRYNLYNKREIGGITFNLQPHENVRISFDFYLQESLKEDKSLTIEIQKVD